MTENIYFDFSRDDIEQTLKEVVVLNTLQHENIVGYKTVWCEYPPDIWQKEQEKSFGVPSSFDDDQNSIMTNYGTSADLNSQKQKSISSDISNAIQYSNGRFLLDENIDKSSEASEDEQFSVNKNVSFFHFLHLHNTLYLDDVIYYLFNLCKISIAQVIHSYGIMQTRNVETSSTS